MSLKTTKVGDKEILERRVLTRIELALIAKANVDNRDVMALITHILALEKILVTRKKKAR